MDLGILTIVPPLVALGLAYLTRQVYVSLITGVFVGYLILAGGNPVMGFLDTLHALVRVFEDAGNTRTILFCIMVGGLIELIERSGGVRGFIRYFSKKLNVQRESSGSRRKIEGFALLTGIIIFVESSISILTVGTIFRPLFDRFGISRERLAYIADSSSAPICILIPFNAWGAYVLGILEDYDVGNPIGIFASSIKFNFYPFLALAVLGFLVFTQRSYGPLKSFKARAVRSKEASYSDGVSNQDRAINMILPIVTMVLMMPLMLAYTGWESVDSSAPFFRQLVTAIGQGSGSFSVLTAVTSAILVSFLLILMQRLVSFSETMEVFLEGMGKLLPLGILMMLAFAINSLCKELGTGQFIASQLQGNIPVLVIPALIFMISAITAFSTGTSWGTFAIMLGIAIPIASQLDISLPLCLAAVLGGGVFGDHCSPISDTTIIASTAADCKHMDHVRTQMPFALVAGTGAVLIYLIVGTIVA